MRVLVANHDSATRMALASIITKLGHECLVAADSSGALEVLSSEGIDVLLTDWMTPGLDGAELCRRVREDLAGGYIYVVVMTALSHREHALVGMSVGADDHLTMPVDPIDVEIRLIAAARVLALHRPAIGDRGPLERANLELLSLSLTDSLTWLGSRRRMEQDLAGAHSRAQRVGRPFSVVLFDIDHFRPYNDHYGDAAGDETLYRVAECLGAVLRRGEGLYRHGDDTFLLVLPDSTAADAAAAAYRARQAIEDAALPHAARPAGPPLVTLSAGVADWVPSAAAGMSELLTHAEGALDEAKSSGGNRVRLAATKSASVPTPR